MPGKIFVSYRRGDERAMAARIRDRLANTFGDANVFMDIDHLIAGQVFDKELEKALAETDVLLAVVGPRWVELLAERLELIEREPDERDYVREEIAAALARGIVVIPVLIETTPLPKAAALPEDIRPLLRHQKHTVTHENFGRDVAGLVEAIRFARKAARPGTRGGVLVRWAGAAALAVLLLFGGMLAYQIVTAARDAEVRPAQGEADKTKAAAAEKARQEEIRRAAEAAAKKKAEAVAKAKRDADEAERQRLAALKEEQERKRAELTWPGRVFRDCADVCPEMVVVPAGEFIMGSPLPEIAVLTKEWGFEDLFKSEGPQRKVRISRPFAVGRFEVTFAEWDGCVLDAGCEHRPSDQGWGRGRRPVVNVSWHDAKEYVAWLSRKTGEEYRLLSEAEWEYAARAGTTTRYAFGDTIKKSQAHFSEGIIGSAGKTVEVGSFAANRFGLHDMHGNVSEWVDDSWHDSYEDAPLDGSVWTGNVSLRALRGGSWVNFPVNLRSAVRDRSRPFGRLYVVGFRVARTL